MAAQAGTSAAVGQSARMSAAVECLGRRPHRLRAETERLALVRGQGAGRAVAREDGQDRDGLTQLAEAGDEAAARERDVVRVRRDEDVGHGRASIPSRTGGSSVVSPRSLGADERDEDAVAVGRLEPVVAVPGDDVSSCRSREPTGMTSRPPSRELLAQGVGDRRRGGRHDDPVPRRPGRVTEAAVGLADLDRARKVERIDARLRGRDERGLALERGDRRHRATRGSRPGSRTRCRSRGSGRPAGRARCSVILATMNGWLIVWPASIGRASSA